MRRRLTRWSTPAAVLVMWTLAAGDLFAQYGGGLPAGMVPNVGQSALGTPPAKTLDPVYYINDSFVGNIEAAVPRNLFAIRFDGSYNIRQPTRSEYLHPKGGLPGGAGFPKIETKLDYFDFTTYAEYALAPWLSTFVEAPYRWLNPQVNANGSGAGDMKWGFKLCTWTSEQFLATVLMRIYQPTARNAAYGTHHWSVEPGLLGAYRFNDKILIEGEFRYWVPIDGSDFAGDLIQYGLGASYGQRNPNGVWYMPVIEGVGWSVLNGKSILASSPDTYIIQDQHGQTIVNGYLGIRWGYGSRMDIYTGYGRCFTGQSWARDFFRVELRYLY